MKALLGRILFVAVACGMAAAADTRPDSPTTKDVKAEIVSVVEGQLVAFRADDFPKAYTFAAQSIRGMFPPAQFELMVKQSYPSIAKSKSASFGSCFDDGKQAVIYVTVEAPDGTRKDFQYTLEKEAVGWRITSVTSAEPPGTKV